MHSLDATHMMWSALRCEKAGIVFAAVHDSYWTHAGSMEALGEILREEFVALHSLPLLEILRDELL